MLQDVELNQRLQERYKLLFTKVVVPVMVVTTLFLVLSHWQPAMTVFFLAWWLLRWWRG